MTTQGNVHDNNVTEAQTALLKAITPHIIAMSPADRQRLIIGNPNLPAASAAWLSNECRLSIKGPAALVIDRSKPFDPTRFIGSGWRIVEEDTRALAITEIDFSKVRFDSGLKEGESVIDGEEKLKRLKQLPGIRLDAKTGQTLYEEKGQATLRWLYDTYGIRWFELAGTVLRYSDGDRCFLCLGRRGVGSWVWGCYWLGRGRRRDGVSPLLAS
jgi:hypothetical protein